MVPSPSAGPIDLAMESSSRRFPGVAALTDVSLRIWGGEVVGLMGENGAGDPTLLRTLLGADVPSAGRLVIDGESLAAIDPAKEARRGIAIVHEAGASFGSKPRQEKPARGQRGGYEPVGRIGWRRASSS